jgi:pimeloyl-ACP methyl ester carboxylesterase
MRDEFVESFDGTRIHYEVYGDENKFPIFMLHGNHMSTHYFRGSVNHYTPHYCVLLVDSRMQGKSGNNQRTLEYRDMARDLFAICQKENFSKINLFGYSDGANLALCFAGMFPERANVLILNSGNITEDGLTFIPRLGIFFEMTATKLFEKVTRISKPYEVVRLMTKKIPLTDAEWKKITQSALVIVGTFDFVKTIESQKIAGKLRNSVLHREKGMTHFYMKQAPKNFRNQVLKFLQENDKFFK